MSVAVCAGSDLRNIFEQTFTDVILATAGGTQICAPSEEIALFSQDSSSLGQFGCSAENQVLVTTAGSSFVMRDIRVHTTLSAFRQVPVNAGTVADPSFQFCLTQDEASTGFLILLAQLIAASAFVSLRITRLPAFCYPLVDFAVGNGVRADLGGACNPPSALAIDTSNTLDGSNATGDCNEPCAVVGNVSLEAPNGPRKVQSVAVGAFDKFSLDVAFEKFVGADFCFSAVDLLRTCGSFRVPCTPVDVTCPPCFTGLPTSGPFVLQTIDVSGYGCEPICGPTGMAQTR